MHHGKISILSHFESHDSAILHQEAYLLTMYSIKKNIGVVRIIFGERNGNPLQYFCQDNPKDRGAWRTIIHGVSDESDATERLSTQGYYFQNIEAVHLHFPPA